MPSLVERSDDDCRGDHPPFFVGSLNAGICSPGGVPTFSVKLAVTLGLVAGSVAPDGEDARTGRRHVPVCIDVDGNQRGEQASKKGGVHGDSIVGEKREASCTVDTMKEWRSTLQGDEPCENTPGWNNGHGWDCNAYISQGWCCGDGACPEQEWTLGAQYNHPEQNCCSCGRKEPLAVVPSLSGSQLTYGIDGNQQCNCVPAGEECVTEPSPGVSDVFDFTGSPTPAPPTFLPTAVPPTYEPTASPTVDPTRASAYAALEADTYCANRGGNRFNVTAMSVETANVAQCVEAVAANLLCGSDFKYGFENTPGWNNGHGWDCNAYISRGWCCVDGACPEQE